MNYLSWNCRGLGSPRAIRILGDLIKSKNPDLVFLSETLVEGSVMKNIAEKLGFRNVFIVEKVGRSGGLAVLWKHNVVCQVVDSSNNYVDIHVTENAIVACRLTCYYGIPDRGRRKEAWEMLRKLSSSSNLPWFIFGDFNDLLYASDKHGTNPHPQHLVEGFRMAIEDCGLTEIDLLRGEFTWEKSKGSTNWVRERVDRAFANNTWWMKFPLCKLSTTHTISSDHDPIILETVSVSYSRKQFRFKFENTWLNEPTFKKEVSDYWLAIPSMHMLPKLLSVFSFMAKWGRNFFHKFRDKVKKQKEVLSALINRIDENGIRQYFAEKSKMDEILFHEELYWRQRAKSFWLTEGDTNSKFSHTAASRRKKLNSIGYLIDDHGARIDNLDIMGHMVVDYFKNMFASADNVEECEENNVRRLISREQNDRLEAEIEFEEFSKAIKQMHPEKSAGPDGLSPAFFQHFWELLGPEIFKCCREWLRDVSFPVTLNDTTLVLIPKKDNVEKLTDLRPIALCNVLYKIVAKVLANRLKEILPDVIADNQSAFVPGRNISDNVLVSFKLLHFMKRKNRGLEGEVALKLDISKAYDRVDWRYLQKRMKVMGFSDKWIKWVMLCVTTVSYMINFNGHLVGPIVPSRGLRQGDLLSPYLFLFCVEGLSHSIKKAAEEGDISGCQIVMNAPSVTHLLFADDSFLFFKATELEATTVKRFLNRYEAESGQAVNYQKSGVFFSANVRLDKQSEIKRILEVNNELKNSNYLGLPSLLGDPRKLFLVV